MSKDYYKTLHIDKNASESEVKKAFYKIAAEHHPDKGGDAEKFKAANEAYQVLSDKEKRKRYDAYGTADEGAGGFGGSSGGGGFGGFGGFGGGGFSGGFGGIDLDEILRSAMAGGFSGFGGFSKGRDIESEVKLTFIESLKGVKKELVVPVYKDGKKDGTQKVNCEIPAGVFDGQTLRVSGYGESVSKGKSGDLHVQIHVEKSKEFSRLNDYDILTHMTIKLSESMSGAKKKIQTPLSGEKEISIPEGVVHGQTLRVKNEGVKGRRSGDLFIEVSVLMPRKITKKVKEAIELLKEEGY